MQLFESGALWWAIVLSFIFGLPIQSRVLFLLVMALYPSAAARSVKLCKPSTTSSGEISSYNWAASMTRSVRGFFLSSRAQ